MYVSLVGKDAASTVVEEATALDQDVGVSPDELNRVPTVADVNVT